MKLLNYLFLLIFCFFYSGCSSKNIVKNETVNVCVIPDLKKPVQMETIKTDLEKEAVNKFMEKHPLFTSKDISFTDKFFYNLKEIDKYCLKAKISANKNNNNSNYDKTKNNDFTDSKEKKFVFIEDFNNDKTYKKYGQNLILSNSDKDKGISTHLNKKTQAEFYSDKNENLELIFNVKHNLRTNNLDRPVHVDLLKICYINSREDQIKFIAEKNNNSKITCDILLGRQKSQNMTISFENNYNTFKIIKSKRQISIWLNNEFAGAFLSGGDIVKSLKFDIDNKTILKHVEIKEL
jgi:PBP1b-binding outer membrane lipoprotein LpoB